VTRRTILHEVQKAAGGRFVDFAGWDMPVQFHGIAAEHQTVRTACGLFDLGHMGRLMLDGPDAATFLSHQVCRKLTGMKSGQVRYGLALASDGTVEDDVLVSMESPTRWHVVVNAGNRDKILGLWQAALPPGTTLTDLSEAQAMIAVQGPQAATILAGLGLDGSSLKYYRFLDLAWQGTTVRLSRTGYTGEDGFECFLPSAQAPALWEAVRAAGAVPCGLGCRDSLRLEAGMPLYGHELDRSITPVEAGLDFAVNPDGGFIGAEVVLQQLRDGAPRRLVGLRMREKRVPRQGYAVQANGAVIGTITSGTLSPTLGQAIGMALVAREHTELGTVLSVDIRGTLIEAEVVALPFYRRSAS
jgi:aminomethyltransferase